MHETISLFRDAPKTLAIDFSKYLKWNGENKMYTLQNNLSCCWKEHQTVNVCNVAKDFSKIGQKLKDEIWHAPSGETLNNHVFYVTVMTPRACLF